MSITGSYPREQQVLKILSTAKELKKNYYHIPHMNMYIKLCEGVKLISWVERYVDDLYGNNMRAFQVKNNKWKERILS